MRIRAIGAAASRLSWLTALAVPLACASGDPSHDGSAGQAGTSGAAGIGGSAGMGTGGATAGAAGSAGGAGSAGTLVGDAGTTDGAQRDGAAGGPLDGATDAALSGGGCTLPVPPNSPPTKLSQTGCVDPTNPTRVASSLIPYDVISPLWSDGAQKSRFISLPTGKKIHVKDCTREPDTCSASSPATYTYPDEGHWDMPVGTVLVKTFSLGNKLIETRLFMHFGEDSRAWAGFSYEWNDEQTEATLVPEEGRVNAAGALEDRKIGAQTWHYPTRTECLGCHTEAAGRSLGLSTQQLNFDFAYPTGKKNQIDALSVMNLFDAVPARLAAYPAPAVVASGSLEQRTRSYLQANCAICHREGGTVQDVDLRFSNAKVLSDLCNVPIERGTGTTPELRLVPGKPAESALSFRMHAPPTSDGSGGPRMPKFGSLVIDAEGTKLIDDWISSVTTCPK